MTSLLSPRFLLGLVEVKVAIDGRPDDLVADEAEDQKNLQTL